MTSTTSKSPRRDGIIAAATFIPVLIPFGMLFGVVATDAGIGLIETMAMTTIVIAGAAQFTAVQLMSEGAPVWLTIIAAVAVNLRMAMYSASLQPYFRGTSFRQRLLIALGIFDQSYALSVAKFDAEPDMTLPQRMQFYFSSVCVIVATWIASSLFGAVFGRVLIPQDIPIEFAMPIMFLAIVAPMLRTLAHLSAALTSILVALALAGLPSGIGLLIAGLAAMAVGAEMERRGYGP